MNDEDTTREARAEPLGSEQEGSRPGQGDPRRFTRSRDDRMIAAYETVIAACNKHGKWVGMGGATAEEDLRRYIGMGVRMVLAGGDLNLMMQAGKQTTTLVRDCV